MEYIYAALLLHKVGKEINEENLRKVIEAAGATADESKIKTLVASLKGVDIEKELKEQVVLPAANMGGATGTPAKKEEKAEEKHEEAAEGLAALFGWD